MLNLERYDEAIWFEFVEGVKFKIRPSPPSVFTEIKSTIRKPFAITQDEKTILVDDVDTGDFAWRLFDNILVEWEGVALKDAKGPEDTKKALYNYAPTAAFIFQKSKELTNSVCGQLDDELKNSKGSQSG